MNTWRDIKEAPLNQAVFATDGDMVFFGRFAMTADRKCMFEGQDIEEACNYGIEPACLTGWQPVPDTWKPGKTADEMFRELGYKKAEENKDYIAYLKKDNWRTEIRFYRMTKRVKKSLYSHWDTFIGPEYLFFNEMLACAQLIREMEANNG